MDRLRVEVGRHQDALGEFDLELGESSHLLPFTRDRVMALDEAVLPEASTTQLTDVVRDGRAGTSAPRRPRPLTTPPAPCSG